MTEQLTVHEWEAVLRGTPAADMRPGETIARYIHRKVEALTSERDRLKRDYNGLLEDCAGCI